MIHMVILLSQGRAARLETSLGEDPQPIAHTFGVVAKLPT
jgi:hypothetical protein